MSAFKKNKFHCGSKKLKRLMERAERKMRPHMDKHMTPEGIYAGVLLSGAAAIVAEGKEDREYLTSTTKMASEISGIPLGAMRARAECFLAMRAEQIQLQRTSPSCGSDRDE